MRRSGPRDGSRAGNRTCDPKAASSATPAIGAWTTKIARQSKACVNGPPSAGPIAAPNAPAAVQRRALGFRAVRATSSGSEPDKKEGPAEALDGAGRRRGPGEAVRDRAADTRGEKHPEADPVSGTARRRRTSGRRASAHAATTTLYGGDHPGDSLDRRVELAVEVRQRQHDDRRVSEGQATAIATASASRHRPVASAVTASSLVVPRGRSPAPRTTTGRLDRMPVRDAASMAMEGKLQDLRKRLAEVSDLGRAARLLGWDQQTMMPRGGAAARAEQLATVGRLAHERFTRPRSAVCSRSCARTRRASPADSDEASLIRVARRDCEKARRVPSDLRGRDDSRPRRSPSTRGSRRGPSPTSRSSFRTSSGTSSYGAATSTASSRRPSPTTSCSTTTSEGMTTAEVTDGLRPSSRPSCVPLIAARRRARTQWTIPSSRGRSRSSGSEAFGARGHRALRLRHGARGGSTSHPTRSRRPSPSPTSA